MYIVIKMVKSLFFLNPLQGSLGLDPVIVLSTPFLWHEDLNSM